jgi:hypothetical protein
MDAVGVAGRNIFAGRGLSNRHDDRFLFGYLERLRHSAGFHDPVSSEGWFQLGGRQGRFVPDAAPAMVQSTTKAGRIRVSVSAAGLEGAVVTITTKA